MEFEYELLEILFSFNYEVEEEYHGFVREDDLCESDDDTVNEIEYDADGIPMGKSVTEIKIREKLIFDFLAEWKRMHPDCMVFNPAINDNIHILGISVIEAVEHASRHYRSTKAVFRLEEILSTAKKVAEDLPKPGNKNQSKFSSMLLMVSELEGLGRVKLSVGVRRRQKDKVEYGIKALAENEEVIPQVGTSSQKKNKRKHRKR